MPEIRDYYAHVREMDVAALHNRRNEIVATAPSGQYRDLADEIRARDERPLTRPVHAAAPAMAAPVEAVLA